MDMLKKQGESEDSGKLGSDSAIEGGRSSITPKRLLDSQPVFFREASPQVKLMTAIKPGFTPTGLIQEHSAITPDEADRRDREFVQKYNSPSRVILS